MAILPAGVFILVAQNGCAPLNFSPANQEDCVRVAELSRAGEHKIALDMTEGLEKKGTTCPEEFQELITTSRSSLDQANAYTRKALEYKKEENLPAARKNMQHALEVYPKYYWVQELLKNIEISIEIQVAVLQDEARLLVSMEKPKEALQKLEEARVLSPQNEELKSETARLQAEIKKISKEDDTPGPPEEIQDPEQTGTSEEEQKVLNNVNEHRQAVIRQWLDMAQQAEQNGKLEVAAKHMLNVLKLSLPEEPLTQETVNYARLLGVKCFSTGNFSMAQVLWQNALKLSPDNSELQKYLKEVEAALDSLQKIKKEEVKQERSELEMEL